MKKRTLILRSGAIGDIIQTFPALKRYKELHPDEELVYMCGKSCSEVLRGQPFIADVLTFNDLKIYQGTFTNRMSEAVRIISAVSRFSKCFVLQDSVIWKSIAVLSGASETHFLPVTKNSQMERYMICLCGEYSVRPEYVFYPQRSCVKHDKPYIAIAPGGGRNSKNDSYAKRWLGYKELIERLDCRVLLLGTSDDSIQTSSDNVTDLCGQTSLSDCYHLISSAETFIGNDSALMHLAACTKTPVIGIFTATLPEKLFPKGTNITAVRSEMNCSPCEVRGRFSKECKQECVKSIKAEEVLNALSSLCRRED